MTKSQNPVFDTTAFGANLRATGLPLVSGAGIFMNKKELNKFIGTYSFTKKEKEKLLKQINSHYEEWKDVPGYKNKYLASNRGRIKSMLKDKRVLKQTKEDYPCVGLYDMGKTTKTLVHRIIATTFLPNPNNKPCVNHLDGNKKNNNVENLAWCTYSENERHSYDVLGKLSPKGMLGKTGGLCKLSKPIIRKNLHGKIIGVFSCAMEAQRELGLSQGTISQVARGIRKSSCYSTFHFISKDRYNKLKKTVKNQAITVKRKLTPDNIREIRKSFDGTSKSGTEIGKKYNIDRTMAYKIYTRQCWAKII